MIDSLLSVNHSFLNFIGLCSLFNQFCKALRVRLDRTYFVEIENWKHCSKIIFKCVNSTMRPIFNEKVAEKWNLWDSWTVHRCIVHKRKVKTYSWRKKKKEGKRANAQNVNVPCIETDTKSLSGHSSSFCLFYLKKKIHKELNIQMGFGIKPFIG